MFIVTELVSLKVIVSNTTEQSAASLAILVPNQLWSIAQIFKAADTKMKQDVFFDL